MDLRAADGERDARVDRNRTARDARSGGNRVGNTRCFDLDRSAHAADLRVAADGGFNRAAKVCDARGYVDRNRAACDADGDGEHLAKVHFAGNGDGIRPRHIAQELRLHIGENHQDRRADAHAHEAARARDRDQPNGRGGAVVAGLILGHVVCALRTHRVGAAVRAVAAGSQLLDGFCQRTGGGDDVDVPLSGQRRVIRHDGVDVAHQHRNGQADAHARAADADCNGAGDHVRVDGVVGEYIDVARRRQDARAAVDHGGGRIRQPRDLTARVLHALGGLIVCFIVHTRVTAFAAGVLIDLMVFVCAVDHLPCVKVAADGGSRILVELLIDGVALGIRAADHVEHCFGKHVAARAVLREGVALSQLVFAALGTIIEAVRSAQDAGSGCIFAGTGPHIILPGRILSVGIVIFVADVLAVALEHVAKVIPGLLPLERCGVTRGERTVRLRLRIHGGAARIDAVVRILADLAAGDHHAQTDAHARDAGPCRRSDDGEDIAVGGSLYCDGTRRDDVVQADFGIDGVEGKAHKHRNTDRRRAGNRNGHDRCDQAVCVDGRHAQRAAACDTHVAAGICLGDDLGDDDIERAAHTRRSAAAHACGIRRDKFIRLRAYAHRAACLEVGVVRDAGNRFIIEIGDDRNRSNPGRSAEGEPCRHIVQSAVRRSLDGNIPARVDGAAEQSVDLVCEHQRVHAARNARRTCRAKGEGKQPEIILCVCRDIDVSARAHDRRGGKIRSDGLAEHEHHDRRTDAGGSARAKRARAVGYRSFVIRLNGDLSFMARSNRGAFGFAFAVACKEAAAAADRSRNIVFSDQRVDYACDAGRTRRAC